MCVFLPFLETRNEVSFGAKQCFFGSQDALFFGDLNVCFLTFSETKSEVSFGVEKCFFGGLDAPFFGGLNVCFFYLFWSPGVKSLLEPRSAFSEA